MTPHQLPADFLAAVRDWCDQDPDAATRAELEQLLTDASPAAEAALHDRFDTRLEFGTAGLRGAIGAGPNRMNRVLVAQAATGFAAWLRGRESTPSVVIGYDGRVNSRVFATDTAELMAGAGLRAILLPRLLPTPVLAFAVRFFDASAGVMVTASHNPAADNGYKVYLGGADAGAQIVAPADAEIAAEIHAIARGARVNELARSVDYETCDESVVDEYVRATAALAGEVAARHPAVKFAYTALHGVGWQTASRVFAAAGFGAPTSVIEQQEPDAAFPTVAFPNPEEPGALDAAFAAATAAGSALIIANDPDADRLAVAIPLRASAAPPAPAGGQTAWRRLTGNEVGALLGWRAAERAAASQPRGALAASLVSSPALAAVARHYGLDFVETLTGFKWISRTPHLVFGFEEALGYLVDPEKIRDKDGISAAVDILSLATELAAVGQNLDDRLLDFAERFGGYASAQLSLRVTRLTEITDVMARLRTASPTMIGSLAVDRVDDFSVGFGRYPASDILRFWLVDGSRVIVRPSGTEPKVKVYLDAVVSVGSASERLAAASAIVSELEGSIRTLLAP